MRQAMPASPEAVQPRSLRKSIALFFSILNKKQRRVYAGLESIQYGLGGDKLPLHRDDQLNMLFQQPTQTGHFYCLDKTRDEAGELT